jgi:amino acid adenylation domain-containing protein
MTNVLEQQWSHKTSDVSEDTIASRFERHVEAVPDKLAIVTDEISLTYRELDLKASRIAAALALLRSPRDQPIALLMGDKVTRIAAMLGALKANRIFIPLAPDSPENWVTQVIEDSGTAQVIIDNSTRSIAELAATGSVTVREVGQLARPLDPLVAHRIASPDDTAYIVYTSGSTGRPKGVAISHRSFIHRCDVRHLLFGVGRGDRHAYLASSVGGAMVTYSLLPLLSGLSLFPFDLHGDGLQKFTLWLIAQKIAFVAFSGSLLRTWLASLPDDLRFPALRSVGVWGETLYAQDVIRLSRHLQGDWCIGHNYASTECGYIASQLFTPSHLPDAGIVAVGHPVDGMEVLINDETGAPVLPGEIGEIVVRSRFLAQGYWNNSDLTAKVFQTDPLDSAIRIYRTGDLGRWRSDGMLEHMGRKGRRIRLRGYNIEPFEVECELMRQPGVRDAVALLHDGAAGQEPCLVGYVVAPANASPSAMRKGLAERLPSYMVPSRIVVLDSFPIATSGKIDHTALPAPVWEETRAMAFRLPSNDREHQLLAIWQEVLNIPKIGVDDDFFELGGDSLQALTVFAEIEARLSCSLSPATIVQAPTIAHLAEFIRTAPGTAESQSLVPLRASGTNLPLFLVSGQGLLAMFFRHLVSDLKSDRPVFGLQPPPLDGKHHVARTVESMAADYVGEIRRVQPHGPYFIAGHSFGCRVSFEMAQQLVRAGERVSFLGLIDTVFRDPPVEGRPWVSEAVHLSRRVRAVDGFQDLLFRGLRFVSHALLDLWIRRGRPIPYRHRAAYYQWLCMRASLKHVTKPYPGHITMFSSAGGSERQTAHWGSLARGGLTVLEVPAGHMEMLEPPHSKLLAEHFDACLDTAVRRRTA